MADFPNPFDDYNLKPAGTEMGYEVHDQGDGRLQHTWWIKGAGGGIHIWARISKLTGWPTEWLGGIEAHYASVSDEYAGWFDPAKPSNDHCWLLDGPCWHDGSSLCFSEQIAPRMPYPDGESPHDFSIMPHSMIGYVLVDWFTDKIAAKADAA